MKMKKIFQNPFLQCCRPLQLKETQTNVSYITQKKENQYDSVQSSQKEVSDYPIELDQSFINNNSHSIDGINRKIRLDNCGNCTKCFLVNLNGGFQKETLKKVESQGDISLIVEVCNSQPCQTIAKNNRQTSIRKYNYVFHPIYHIKEHEMIKYFYCVIIFDHLEHTAVSSTHKIVLINLLSLLHSIYRKKVSIKVPITFNRVPIRFTLKYIHPNIEENTIEHIKYSKLSKANCQLRRPLMYRSIKSQIKLERAKLIKPTKKFNRICNKVDEIPSEKDSKGVFPCQNNEKIKNLFSNHFLTNCDKINKENYSSVNHYKDFLQMWKRRKVKDKYQRKEKNDITISETASNYYQDSLMRIPSKAYMIRYINKRYKNIPISALSTNTFVKGSKNIFMKNSCRYQSRFNQRNPSNIINVSLREIKSHFINSIYDRIVTVMAEKLWILLTIFDKKISNPESTHLPVKLDDDDNKNKIWSDMKEENKFIIENNKSVYTTSNSRDYTESTALDIASDQAYSEEGSLLLSL